MSEDDGFDYVSPPLRDQRAMEMCQQGTVAGLKAEIGRLRQRVAELEAALREYACTATDHPCGCYQQFLSEKSEIEQLRAELAAARERCVRLLENEAGKLGIKVSGIAAAIRKGE